MESHNSSQMHVPWRRVPATELLVQFERLSQGYSLRLCDLEQLWEETLDRRGLIRRALDLNTSIDPSEGPQALQQLLDELQTAVCEAAALEWNRQTSTLQIRRGSVVWTCFLQPSTMGVLVQPLILQLAQQQQQQQQQRQRQTNTTPTKNIRDCPTLTLDQALDLVFASHSLSLPDLASTAAPPSAPEPSTATSSTPDSAIRVGSNHHHQTLSPSTPDPASTAAASATAEPAPRLRLGRIGGVVASGPTGPSTSTSVQHHHQAPSTSAAKASPAKRDASDSLASEIESAADRADRNRLALRHDLTVRKQQRPPRKTRRF